ncbi:hypothetical protein [Fimbriiglobus ruber]|uniref:Uncharacterized protein n=1 Tax=Fimbriiglobus ruber TaxID=1908690 RepID=A0A225DTW2_9BACT|nr:hypothetical protein [Fimbriiglobus ruber]OWK43044.1 hypothetical protein FRUB_02643 [Fimbriiglobus ruber]
MIPLAMLLVLIGDGPADTLGRKMLPVYFKDAREYSIAVASAPDKPLELKPEPVFEWSNPARNGGQQGVIFVWLRDGRPAAFGCIFSSPSPSPAYPGGHRIEHEFHALDPERLVVTRDSFNQWKPKEGLARAVLPDAGTPADSAATRLLQMRGLAKEFTGHTIDHGNKRWDLRPLPTPLYRYPTAKTGVVDGAVFALVSDAGTDPEVLLVLEAREKDGKLQWEYACGRFYDWEIHVQRKGRDAFTSIPSDTNPYPYNPAHTYRTYPDKIVTTDGKILARVRQTEKNMYGDIVPVEAK